MAEENFQEKTEKATPRKREDVRKKGEVAKSRELPSVAVLISGIVSLSLFGAYIFSRFEEAMLKTLKLPDFRQLDLPENFLIFTDELVRLFILAVIPVLAAAFITAVLANVMQVGFMASGELIKPKISKLNPIKGFGRLFSKQSIMELFKSLMKLAIVGGVAYFTVKGEMANVMLIGALGIEQIVAYIMSAVFKIVIRCAIAMIVLIVIDYAFQKWEFENRIKMTKQEVKDEFKKSEGDPLIKARIRSVQRTMAQKRMMQAVPDADVIVTNPTHLAVALKYDGASMSAPKVVAKGAENIAKRIKELARKSNVPIVENKELARNLFRMVEIGQEIPADLFQAVAEILAYIYSLKGNRAVNYS